MGNQACCDKDSSIGNVEPLGDALPNSDEPEAAAEAQPVYFNVKLDRTNDSSPLGIDCDRKDGVTLLVERINTPGLLENWNTNNESSKVVPGDRIVEVNGKSGDVFAIIEELKKQEPLSVKIMRAPAAPSNAQS
mmetsp:Transcript_57438/g.136546  ORF Transcript_57438/g.136546 Transcript_57438/m.136546 type:complete len:134 (-) Transcript_57438:258-659(-)